MLKDLHRFPSGKLPQDVFSEIARLVVTPTLVVVPLYQHNKEVEVFLTRRSPRTDVYPDMLNLPGKIILASDESLLNTFNRLVKTELEDVIIVGEPIFVTISYINIPRGRELSLIYRLEIQKPPNRSDCFSINMLPNDLVPSDVIRIKQAVEHLESDEGINQSGRPKSQIGFFSGV